MFGLLLPFRMFGLGHVVGIDVVSRLLDRTTWITGQDWMDDFYEGFATGVTSAVAASWPPLPLYSAQTCQRGVNRCTTAVR